MNYTAARPLIRSGDVLAWTSKGESWIKRFLIWIGRLGELSEWTHVGVAWVVGHDIFVIEAVGTGVRLFPLERDLPAFHFARNTDLTEQQLDFALSKIGQRYSWLECVLAWARLNDPRNSRWECAELAAAILELDCQAVPAAVINLVMEQGAVQTLITHNESQP